MADERQGEFADPVEPVGMSYPLDVEILADIDMGSQVGRCAVQFIENDPVVNPADPCLTFGRRIEIK